MPNSIYNPISLEVGNILKDVQTGKIGLPDLQRPFVWATKRSATCLIPCSADTLLAM